MHVWIDQIQMCDYATFRVFGPFYILIMTDNDQSTGKVILDGAVVLGY